MLIFKKITNKLLLIQIFELKKRGKKCYGVNLDSVDWARYAIALRARRSMGFSDKIKTDQGFQAKYAYCLPGPI